MTGAVVFRTPGLLDLRAITSLGVNTKPNSDNPIGFFGTGLKYSVAVLCREGLPMTLVTGGEVYAFYRKTERFRDKDFDFVRMKRETLERGLGKRAQYSELSYTTEFGKNWKLWQVFRELYSNTLDEGGETYVVGSTDEVDFQDGYTYIIVVGAAFVQEYHDRERNFLPDGLKVALQNERLQVLDRPSKHIYYRGMRVFDLDKPSAQTYNFLSGVELTEDRTAKNSFMLKHYIENYLITEAPQAVAAKAVAAAEDTFEGSFSYGYHTVAPSAAFAQAVASTPRPTSAARGYVRKRAARRAAGDPLANHPLPWEVMEGGYVVDARGTPVLQPEHGTLSPLQLRYVVALVNQRPEDDTIDAWAGAEADRGTAPEDIAALPLAEREPASLLDDVPF